MMGFFVAPHVYVEKGTPTYELLKGVIICLVISILSLTYIVVTH
jgi:hypothetical protein